MIYISRIFVLAMLGIALAAGTSFAQANIETITTTTTEASTSFGFDMTIDNLNTFMQNDVSTALTALDCVAGTGPGLGACTGLAYSKASGMPGAFTSNPFKVVYTTADFGCGGDVLFNSCTDLAPPQTAPTGTDAGNFDLSGTLSITNPLGDGLTADMPSGSIAFVLTPDGLGGATADITQAITQNISGLADFTETDAATGFTTSNLPAGFTGAVGLTATMAISQTDQSGLGTTAMDLGTTVLFTYGDGLGGLSAFPEFGSYFTPGLNIDSASLVSPDAFPQ